VRANEYLTLEGLLAAVRQCRACEKELPLGVRVHASGIPWDDASGARLRNWMGMDTDRFYDESQIAIIPMAFRPNFRTTSSCGLAVIEAQCAAESRMAKDCAVLCLHRPRNNQPVLQTLVVTFRMVVVHVLGHGTA
jgi:hypothetical protein